MAYLNCPECFYRVRTAMARNLDGEASCPRCARLGRLIAMYSTEISLRPTAERAMIDRSAEGTGEAGEPRLA